MSLSLDPILEKPRPALEAYLRPVALAALMVAEILFLTIRFDTPRGVPADQWWGMPIIHAHEILKFLLLLTVASAAFGGIRLAHRLRRALAIDLERDYPWTNWLLAHTLCLILLTGLTSLICAGSLVASPRPGLWMMAWVGSIGATAGTCLMAVLSPEGWLTVIRRNLRSIFAGLAVGGLAYGLGNSTGKLWSTMAGATLVLVRGMLGLFSSDVHHDPVERIIGVGRFDVRIGDACSGYEGIGLVVAFLAGYFWFFRHSLRWPRAYALIGLGVVAIWLLNSARIGALVMIGAWGSPEVAMGGFHSQAGWLSFLAVSLGLVAISRKSRYFAADPGSLDVAGPSLNPSLAFLGPFLVVLATALVTGALSSGFDALYGLRVFTGGLALWYFRREFAGLIGNGTWVGVGVGVVAFGLWVALEPVSTGAGRSLALSVHNLPGGRGWAWIVLRVIGSVAIVPVVEELAFRGYLVRRVVSTDFESVPLDRFSWAGLLISSAAFGMLHGRWLAGLLVGVLYGLALYRRGRLGDAIVAHAVTNALIAVTVLITGDWTMWT